MDSEIQELYQDHDVSKLQLNAKKLAITTLPTKLSMFNLAESRKITHIAAGLNYNIIIENRRTIYAWGVNTFG